MDGFSDEDEHMMQSWVHVDPDSLALENSCVSDSMYLVHHDSTQSLQPGERFLAKAHALHRGLDASQVRVTSIARDVPHHLNAVNIDEQKTVLYPSFA